VLYPLHGWFSCEGEHDDGIVDKAMCPGDTLPRALVLPSEPQRLELHEDVWHAYLLILFCGCLSAQTFWPWKTLLWFQLGEGRAGTSLFPVSITLVKRDNFNCFNTNLSVWFQTQQLNLAW
jgi:hypothetical protein